MIWKTPNIRIGNVPILAQDFDWALTAGVLPFSTSIIVASGEINNQLKLVENPTNITIELTGGTTGRPDPVKLEIKNIYLIEPKQKDPYHVSWTVSDSRYAWRGLKLYCSYNKTRLKNQIGVGVAAAETEPAALRKPFDTFRIGRYLPWSVKIESEKPYNMQEIAEKELLKLGINIKPNISQKGAYIVENVKYEGVDIYQGMADLLFRSRLQLGIDLDGDVHVYSLDFFDDTQINVIAKFMVQKKTDPQVLYMRDLKRIRPKKINVRFPKKIEVRVIGSTSIETVAGKRLPQDPNPPLYTQKDINDWRVIGAENVIQVPYEIKRVSGKGFYLVGEWIPMWEYLSAIGLTETKVQEKWHLDLLERDYARQRELEEGLAPSSGNELLAYHIISAIRTHYRQTYQLEPYMVDRMSFWEANRAAVINNYDHFNPRSPLFSDYCVLPEMNHPGIARRTVGWDRLGYNWLVNIEDPIRNRPTLGTIEAVNVPFGIFRVSYPPMIDKHIKKIYPFALDPLPTPFISSTTNSIKLCHLKTEHTMETVISVVWDTDKRSKFEGVTKYFHINVDFSAQGGIAPNDFDYLSQLEYARFPIKEIGTSGVRTNDPNKPINQGILEAIANSESARLINQFRDRYVGKVTFAGAIIMNLTGNIKSLEYKFTPRGGLETTIDMRDLPPDPTLEQTLGQEALNFLQKQVSRGGNINKIGGVV